MHLQWEIREMLDSDQGGQMLPAHAVLRLSQLQLETGNEFEWTGWKSESECLIWAWMWDKLLPAQTGSIERHWSGSRLTAVDPKIPSSYIAHQKMQPHDTEEQVIHSWPLYAASEGLLEVWSLNQVYFWGMHVFVSLENSLGQYFVPKAQFMLATGKHVEEDGKRPEKGLVGSSGRGTCWAGKSSGVDNSS